MWKQYTFNAVVREELAKANEVAVKYNSGVTMLKVGQSSIEHLYKYNCAGLIHQYQIIK